MRPAIAWRAAEQRGDALLHLLRGLVGKSDGEDRFRLHAQAFDEMRNAISDDTRLAAAGPSENQQGAFSRFHGASLLRVELIEEICHVQPVILHDRFWPNKFSSRLLFKLMNFDGDGHGELLGVRIKTPALALRQRKDNIFKLPRGSHINRCKSQSIGHQAASIHQGQNIKLAVARIVMLADDLNKRLWQFPRFSQPPPRLAMIDSE